MKPNNTSSNTRSVRARRTLDVIAILRSVYPDAHCELQYRNPLELLVATILSAQCTDRRVNMVTPALFERYPDAAAYALGRLEEIESVIHSTGFFRSKARNIQAACAMICGKHGGDVPQSLAELTLLPGVGRKTANVVLGNAFGREEGIVVDTHVGRLARRLGLTRHTDPVKVEMDLCKWVPREHWTTFSHWLILHGRRCCTARNPACGRCELWELCPTGRKLAPR